MKKIYMGGLVVLVVGAFGAFFFINNKGNTAVAPSAQVASIGAVVASSTQGSSTTEVFSSSPYVANAHLISTTSTYDAATQQALKGFQVKKQVLADGSLQVTLIALQSEYPNQSYTVKSGEKLYFVEASSADDSVNEDHAPADDRAILVSSNGMIL
jgi:hypothetical protein